MNAIFSVFERECLTVLLLVLAGLVLGLGAARSGGDLTGAPSRLPEIAGPCVTAMGDIACRP